MVGIPLRRRLINIRLKWSLGFNFQASLEIFLGFTVLIRTPLQTIYKYNMQVQYQNAFETADTMNGNLAFWNKVCGLN